MIDSYGEPQWHATGTSQASAAVLHVDSQSHELTLKEVPPGQKQLKPCDLKQAPLLENLVRLQCRWVLLLLTAHSQCNTARKRTVSYAGSLWNVALQGPRPQTAHSFVPCLAAMTRWL